MLLTITPNICIERTVTLDHFATSEVHRVPPERLSVNVGGKGINAARVAAQLGTEVQALAWVGKRQRAWFEAQLAGEGVAHSLVETSVDTRVCTNILSGNDATGYTKTEVVEAGSPLTIADGTNLLQRFAELLPRASLVALCGSYPPAAPGEAKAFEAHATLLCRMAKHHGVKVLYDGKGRPFEMAVRHAPPWCIKPNLEEASQLLHRRIATPDDERKAVKQFLQWGVEVVLLSCGARGLWLGHGESVSFLESPRVHEVSPVGSGDALVGAFAAQFLQGKSLLEAARWGVAAGAANAAQKRSAFCSAADIATQLPQVRLQRQEFSLTPR